MRRHAAEAAAEQLLDEFGIDKPPVPVEEIADARSIVVLRQRFDGDQSGFAFRNNDRLIIGVNSQTARKRQRFTIAHELGHLLLHNDPLRIDRAVHLYNRDRTSSLATDQDEIDANAFAAALLMPEEQVLQEVDRTLESARIDTRERLISHLAQLFDVSSEAMGYRLINLGVLRS